MKAFLGKYKGYLIHAAAVSVIFLSPSVKAALAAHPDVSVIGSLAWGAVLHYFNGK